MRADPLGHPRRRRHRRHGRRRHRRHAGQRAAGGRRPATPTARPPSPPSTASRARTAPTPSWSPTPTSTSSTSPPRTRQHHEHALLALRAGKPVLVEKAFTLNARAGPRGRRRGPRAPAVLHGGDVDAAQSAGAPDARRCSRDGAHRRGRRRARRPVQAFRVRPGRTGCSTSRPAAARCSTSASTRSTFAWLVLGRPDTQSRHRLAGADRLRPDRGAAVGLRRRPGGADLLQRRRATARTPRSSPAPTAGCASRPGAPPVGAHGAHLGRRRGDRGRAGASATATATRSPRSSAACAPASSRARSVPLDDTVGILEVLDDARRQLGVRYPADAEG